MLVYARLRATLRRLTLRNARRFSIIPARGEPRLSAPWEEAKTPYAGNEDRLRLENEKSWEDRDVPKTLFGMISRTASRVPNNKAISFQLTSGPTDKAETLTWKQVQEKVAQTANMLRRHGIGEKDVVAYVLPNCTETLLTLLGGAIAGIVNPINPLLAPEQIGAILRETGAKVVVTLRAVPKTDGPTKWPRPSISLPASRPCSRLT